MGYRLGKEIGRKGCELKVNYLLGLQKFHVFDTVLLRSISIPSLEDFPCTRFSFLSGRQSMLPFSSCCCCCGGGGGDDDDDFPEGTEPCSRSSKCTSVTRRAPR